MGLDMYLSKKTYVGAEYKHRNVIVNALDITIDGKPVKVNPAKLSYIIEAAIYWRKSNNIHKWFVDNVQKGEDDCGTYEVSIDQLKTLLDLCKQVQANHDKAEELLPSQGGFFFGSTDYDEWYFKDIDETIVELEALIANHSEDAEIEYEYYASW